MICHCLIMKKIAEYTNPSNKLYKSQSCYFVEFFLIAGLLLLAFKCDIYGRVFSRPWVLNVAMNYIAITQRQKPDWRVT